MRKNEPASREFASREPPGVCVPRRVSPDEIVRRAQIIGATHELGG